MRRLLFGFFMSQLDIAARRNELLLEELNFIHAPAFRIANVVGLVHQIGRTEPASWTGSGLAIPGIRWLGFDVACGIIIEWTLIGLLAGMIQNVWALRKARFPAAGRACIIVRKGRLVL